MFMAKEQWNIWAILSIVFAFLMPLLGLIFGIIALIQIRKNPKQKGKEVAIVGTIFSGMGMLLVLLFIGGMFSYFGIFSPRGHAPNRCTLPSGFTCRDWLVSSETNSMTMVILNGIGKDITVSQINVEPAQSNPINGICTYSDSDGTIISNGEFAEFTLNCPEGIDKKYADDKKYRWEIEFDWVYTDAESGFVRTFNGELYTLVD